MSSIRVTVLIAVYGLLLLTAVIAIPLHLSEILQLVGSSRHSLSALIGWIAQTPASAPLNYFVQLPFVLAGGASRIAARMPSLLFALGSSYLFLRLARSIQVRQPYLAVVLFMLLPVHYRFATQGRPVEQALFLLLLATISYLHLVESPDIRRSALYAAILVLCLYTDPSSYLPAVGYFLFLLRFLDKEHGRRVVWFALPATLAPVLLFLPYYFWSHSKANPDWLFESFNYPADLPVFVQMLHSIASGEWNGYVVAILLTAGSLSGAWRSFKPVTTEDGKGFTLFWLFGGVISATLIPIAIDTWKGYSFSPSHVLWAAPGMILLSFAGVESVKRKQLVRPLTIGLAGLSIVLCAVGDLAYLRFPTDDLQTEAALIRPELTGDSCVVFVSERLSKFLFLVFDPSLDSHECLNFFHNRVVLASHSYVPPDAQKDAESYFRGLNFVEKKRRRAGGGQIVVMEQSQ